MGIFLLFEMVPACISCADGITPALCNNFLLCGWLLSATSFPQTLSSISILRAKISVLLGYNECLKTENYSFIVSSVLYKLRVES